MAYNLDQYIGDPGYAHSSSYAELVSSSEAILGIILTGSNDLQDFTRIMKFYDNVLYKSVQDFVPARTNMSSGIIIKPHLLERNKTTQVSVKSSEYDNISGSLVITDTTNYSAVKQQFVGDITITGSIDSGSRSGSDGGTFGSSTNYSTAYSESVITPDGLATYTYHNQEEPKYDGEFSGSEMKLSSGELNVSNAFKYDETGNTLYNYILIEQSFFCHFAVSASNQTVSTPSPTPPPTNAPVTPPPTNPPTTPPPTNPPTTPPPTTPPPTTPPPTTPPPTAPPVTPPPTTPPPTAPPVTPPPVTPPPVTDPPVTPPPTTPPPTAPPVTPPPVTDPPVTSPPTSPPTTPFPTPPPTYTCNCYQITNDGADPNGSYSYVRCSDGTTITPVSIAFGDTDHVCSRSTPIDLGSGLTISAAGGTCTVDGDCPVTPPPTTPTPVAVQQYRAVYLGAPEGGGSGSAAEGCAQRTNYVAYITSSTANAAAITTSDEIFTDTSLSSLWAGGLGWYGVSDNLGQYSGSQALLIRTTSSNNIQTVATCPVTPAPTTPAPVVTYSNLLIRECNDFNTTRLVRVEGTYTQEGVGLRVTGSCTWGEMVSNNCWEIASHSQASYDCTVTVEETKSDCGGLTGCSTPSPTPAPVTPPPVTPPPVSTYYAIFTECGDPSGAVRYVSSTSAINTSLIFKDSGTCFNYNSAGGAGEDGDISTFTDTYVDCAACTSGTPSPTEAPVLPPGSPAPTTPAPVTPPPTTPAPTTPAPTGTPAPTTPAPTGTPAPVTPPPTTPPPTTPPPTTPPPTTPPPTTPPPTTPPPTTPPPTPAPTSTPAPRTPAPGPIE